MRAFSIIFYIRILTKVHGHSDYMTFREHTYIQTYIYIYIYNFELNIIQQNGRDKRLTICY